MIEELVQLVADARPVTDGLKLEAYAQKLKPGLYLGCGTLPDGSYGIREALVHTAKSDVSPELRDMAARLQQSDYLNSNKALLFELKQVLSASPYVLHINKMQSPFTRPDKSVDIAEVAPRFLALVEEYFKTAQALLPMPDGPEHADANAARLLKAKRFENCALAILRSLSYTALEQRYGALGDDMRLVLVDMDTDLHDYAAAHSRYLETRLFLQAEHTAHLGGEPYGTLDFFMSYNAKKPFVPHASAPFQYNVRQPFAVAEAIAEFGSLAKLGLLRLNPLPIFVDRPELNGGVVQYIREEKRPSFAGLLDAFSKGEQKNVGNYYLLQLVNTKDGLIIQDIDFVSAARTVFPQPVRLDNRFFQGEKAREATVIRDVFAFEKQVLPRLFNNQLVTRFTEKDKAASKDTPKAAQEAAYVRHYFDEPKPTAAGTTQVNMLRARRPFYDFIYKGQWEVIPQHFFDELLWAEILDTLHRDQLKDNRHSEYYALVDALTLWFSFRGFFSALPVQATPGTPSSTPETSTQTPRTDMSEQLSPLLEKAQAIANNPEVRLESLDEALFCAGQAANYLYTRSRSANLTYSILDPFMRKNSYSGLRQQLQRALEMYGHAIEADRRGRFEGLMAAVLTYGDARLTRDDLACFLAGFMAPAVIFEKKAKPAGSADSPNDDSPDAGTADGTAQLDRLNAE